MSDDFPTPRGQAPSTSRSTDGDLPTPRASPPREDGTLSDKAVSESPASSDTESDHGSMWSKGSSRSDYDELYDITDSDGEELPIKLSGSVKKRMARAQADSRLKPHRYPSLSIPSPSEWPTIEKLRSATALSPPIRLPLSPAVLSQLQHRGQARIPSSTSAPSLDGSMTSEELASFSCPSTPDIQQAEDDSTWEPPTQLDPASISLLQRLHPEEEPASHMLETVIEIPEEAVADMEEIVKSPSSRGRFKINTKNLAAPADCDADDELSALSVPSPGGFFASLDSSVARRTWSASGPSAPTTSTATSFYGVPWQSDVTTSIGTLSSGLPTSTATSFYNLPWSGRPENPVEHHVTIASPASACDPITAKKGVFSPTDVIAEVDEIDECYDNVLKQTAEVNIDRTQLWLCTQTEYMKAICADDTADVVNTFRDIEDAVPKTPEVQSAPMPVDISPESKKSVRFADLGGKLDVPDDKDARAKRISPIHDGTFWEGWRHNKRSQRARDVFQHRQTRAEADHVRRTSNSKSHIDQLQGRFEITVTERPAPPRPISTFDIGSNGPEEDDKKVAIKTVEVERQALEQMQSSAWHVSARKEVHGGKLISSPIVGSFKGRRDVKILDLAGQVHCSWAWTVAAEHPVASVITTVSSDAEAHVAESGLEGPSNHVVVAAPKAWELPFDDDTFDVISARNMYAHLKTLWPKGAAADEWDLTLRECLRVLKRGGYLEFDLLDAELAHPDSAGQALGVEFAFTLKTRGYDPCAGKNFLPRLKRAGFGEIKRAWMVLPVADALPRWTDSGKTPSSTSTVTPGQQRDDYFGSSAVADTLGERQIGPNGSVVQLECPYEPPVTGSTKDVRALTGLVGARMWEQWMLKLNQEMGRNEERCLDGVAKALEEGGKGCAGWRCLVGWARKPM